MRRLWADYGLDSLAKAMIAVIAFFANGLLCQQVEPIMREICLVTTAGSISVNSCNDENPICSRREITVAPTPLRASIWDFSDSKKLGVTTFKFSPKFAINSIAA
jgi:hypothetical protein